MKEASNLPFFWVICFRMDKIELCTFRCQYLGKILIWPCRGNISALLTLLFFPASRNEAHTDSDQLHPGKRVISHPEGQQSSIRQKLEVVDPQARVTQAIHDLLQPRYPGDCPIQPAHSRAFISAVVPCEVCRAIAKETANVLVCDACEKLLHLRCLQSYLMMGIPKGDWYCPHCSDSCKDKQRPPKYGRVKAGFSFKTSRMKGKSSGKGSPTTQKKQPPISADGKSNQQAISKAGMKTSAITQKFEDSAHSSSKSSQSILEHGNSGGGFTALLDSVAQEGQSNLRMAGNCQSSSCIPQPQISTRSAFLQSHSVEPAAVLSTQPQSHRLHSGQGIANAGENNLQFIKPAESCSDTSLLTAASRPFDDKKSNSKEDFEILDEKTNASAELNAEQIYKEVDRFGIEWASDVIHRADGKHFYSACTVGGQLYRLHDCALFRPETPNVPPYIAHLQALWEESGAKWVRVNWFYYPADMIMLPGRPLNPEINEVYESNHGDNNLVGTIQGQCLVLQPDCYAKEMERRQELLKCGNTGEALVPIFLCRWMYDVATATFRPVSGTS
ncbi:hypothetical protein KP509_1Z309400 [Ceratopteris richardii]|nr:hypothetical protein KP509_1Z309400 [Ceratopteris richardii]